MSLKPLTIFRHTPLLLVTVLMTLFPQAGRSATGYVNVSLQRGRYHALANPLWLDTNELSAVVSLPSTATGSRFLPWSGTEFHQPFPEWMTNHWSFSLPFPAGTGAVFYATADCTITMVGEVMTGWLTNCFPAGYALRSSQVPQAGTLDDLGLTGALAPGDGVLLWNVTTQRWSAFQFRGAAKGWRSAAPSIEVAESFFIVSTNGGEWVRNFGLYEARGVGAADEAKRMAGLDVTLLPDDPAERANVLAAMRPATQLLNTAEGQHSPHQQIDGSDPLGYVIFANRFGPLDAPVTRANGVPCEGSDFVAALQFSPDGTVWAWSETPVQPVSFADGFGPGYFFGGTRTVPATNATWLRVHVWTAGLTWEQARAETSAEWGVSAPVRVDLPSAAGDSPTPPPLLTRLLPLRLNQGAGPPPLAVTLPASVSESDGVVASAGRVWLAETLSTNLTVALISSDTNRLTVPAQIVIPANQLSATFDLAMTDNWLAEGNQTVTVTASAAGFVGGASFLIVLEDEIAPTIQTHPANQTVEPGQTATFTVTASGSDPLAYQWRFNSTNTFANETNATLTLSGVTLPQAGNYSVLVTNAYGSVTSAPAQLTVKQTITRANPAPLNIPASGKASLYPSVITVSNLAETLVRVSVTLSNLSHTWPDDLDMLLVGPAGQKILLMSDAGGSTDIAGSVLTFADSGPALPDSAAIAPGTYHPTDYETTDVLPAPAPGRPYGTNLAVFIGTDPNGVWSLFVNDDSSGDAGNLAGGWSIDFTLASPLRIISAQVNASVFSFAFLSAAGTNYTVQYKTILTDAVWQTLTTRSGTGGQLTVTDAVTQCTSRFYRVRQD